MKDWLKKQLARMGLGTETADLAAGMGTGTDEPLSVLLVDDTPANLKILIETLKPLGQKLLVAEDGSRALAIARRARPALILLDVMMPEMDGYEVCRRLKEDVDLQHISVIFCSSLDDTQAKVKGLKLGAVDFITKPFEPEEVIARVGAHLAVQELAVSLRAQNHALRHELEVAREHQDEAMRRLDCALIGSSVALRQVRAAIQGFAASDDDAILLHGLPSCGDEAVARAIHAASARRDRPFITVDCSRLTLEEQAALFAPGRSPRSKLALAQGGTLYVQHLEQLSPEAQDHLHELLVEAGEARAEQQRPVTDVRFIAYASRDGMALTEGFTPRLQLKVGQAALRLPPLAERRDDILPIATELLVRHASHLGKCATTFEADTARRMREHGWPGNLRELEDVIVRSLSAASGASLVVDRGLLQAGTPLGGYRLLEKIGYGSMGDVWKAQHQLLARRAAVKLIRGEGIRHPEVLARFRLEATATAALASPHTVTLYDFGVTERGEFYYVMELLDGMDLEELRRRFGPPEPARVAHLLMQACKSLAEAHALGIVHRDIKPSNLFACRLGLEVDFLKILDFGLVRRNLTGEDVRLTQVGVIGGGTPAYMAPETISAQDVLDGRTDMYSLGATAYDLLAGATVFGSPDPRQVMRMHLSQVPVPIESCSKAPEVLAGLIMRCLAKNVDERPTAVEMWKALEDSRLPALWTAEAPDWWATHLPKPPVDPRA